MYFKSLPSVLKKEITWHKDTIIEDELQHVEFTDRNGNLIHITENDIAPTGKRNYWPIFTAGAGLFSDGYVNNSIGTVSTCLSKIYGKQYTQSTAIQNVSAIAFAGTVLGQLIFGVFSDFISRKTGMLVSSGGLILFSILGAGSWGVGTEAKYGGNAGGLFAALTAYRFFLGIFIGAEYPTGSAACAEASALLPSGKRNRYFAWFTMCMIVSGFVTAAFVPLVLLWICGPKNLQPVWRITLGFGAIFPCSLFIMRLFFKEGTQFQKLNLKNAKFPYLLVLKYYWFRLTVISVIWWIYDFCTYSFTIYASTIISKVVTDGSLYKTFGWTVVLNLFYIPGALLGAYAADFIGPRLALVVGVFLQATAGYIMGGLYSTLEKHIGGFVVVYGLFITFGAFGPGTNIGLLAAKTSATPVRGVYYGIAAAIGKVGAFVGTYALPAIQRHYGGVKGRQVPFYVAASLAIFAALLALFALPPVDQEAMQREDFEFLTYLNQNGYDLSTLGDGSLVNTQQREMSDKDADSDVNKEIVDLDSEEKKLT